MNRQMVRVPGPATEVIECEAIPIERTTARLRKREHSAGYWIWFLVAVLGLIKLAAALIVAVWAITHYPRVILAAFAGLGSLVGFTFWRRRRQAA